MLVYVIVVGLAALIPAVTRGSYTRLLETRWHFRFVLFAGLTIQIALEYVTIPRAHWHDVGFGLLVASYVLILSFAARNLVIRGMGIVFIGIACNGLVITLNQGMPIKIPADWQDKPWVKPTVKHHPQQPDDKLRFLSDIIVVKHPFDNVMSFGDLIMTVGLIDVAYNASRKPKRRRPRSSRGRSRRRGSTRGAPEECESAPERTLDLAGPEQLERALEPADAERPLVLSRTRAREHPGWFDADG